MAGKNSYYCYQCLNKVSNKQARISTTCPRCKCEMRGPMTKQRRAQVVTRLKIKRGISPKKHRGEYEKYLASELWNTIRTRVLERDSHTCRDCGGHANTVHHESYAPEVMDGKDDSKLVSLCWPCHKLRHPEKRNKRRRKSQSSGKTATNLGNQTARTQESVTFEV